MAIDAAVDELVARNDQRSRGDRAGKGPTRAVVIVPASSSGPRGGRTAPSRDDAAGRASRRGGRPRRKRHRSRRAQRRLIVPLVDNPRRRPSSARARSRRSPGLVRRSTMRRSSSSIMRAVAGAAAQPGKGLDGQGARPHRPDPGDLRRARAHPAKARCRSSSRISTYQKSRLVRSWTHLERQRGGFGFLGGPGETQIEADRRLIEERIARIERELEKVKRTRELHRDSAPQRAVPGRRARRLHQCRQVDAVQPADRGRACWPRTCCSPRSIRRCARVELPHGGRDRSCPTRSASSPTCRPCWSPPSARRWKR